MKIVAAASGVTEFCSICNSPQASSHFGVISCRSCASFFRRAIVLGRDYVCKREEKCDIKEARTSCAGCRMEKCKKVGMEVQKIRRNFDPHGPRTSEKSASLQIPSPSTPSSSTLSQMVEGYRIFLADTKTLYFVFHPEHAFTKEIVFKTVTAKEHTFMDRVSIAYYVKALNGYFQPFAQLSIEEKKSVLDTFHFRFSFLNEQYLNTVYFLHDDRKQFFHYGAYIEIDSPEHLFTPHKFSTNIQNVFAPGVAKMRRVAKRFRALQPDETEIAGLIGMILWREVSILFPDRGYDRFLEKIEGELAKYCRTTHPKDPCRMGRITYLLRGVEELSLMLTERLAIAVIYNEYEEEATMNNTNLFKP